MKHILPFVALLFSVSLAGADWPHYLGPNHNNTSDETGLAATWPPEGPPKVWEYELGPGFASPAVVCDRLYAVRRIQPRGEEEGPQKDVVLCLNALTGEEIWASEMESTTRDYGYPGSRTSPAVKDGRVFVIGPAGEIYALAAADGTLLWRRNLLADFQSKQPGWAVGQSPLVWEDLVICTPMGRQAAVVALAADSGKTVWEHKASEIVVGGDQMTYNSPILATIHGHEQVLAITGNREGTRVGGYDPRTGKNLWSYNGWHCHIPIPAPLHLGDGRIFITGEYGAGSAMIRVNRQGDTFAAEELFKIKDGESQIHQPFLVGEHLYLNSNGNRRRDGFLCLDLNGEIVWRTERNPNFERGGMILADGRIYALHGNNGTLVMFEPSPEGFNQVARCKPLEGKTVWTPPVLSNGRLYIRDQQKLVCLDVRAQ